MELLRLALVATVLLPAAAYGAAAPNFVVILVDDMDVMMNSSHRGWMPITWSSVADPGTVFRNMAVSMAWCCPSRVSLFTGKLVHNSNITSSSPPNGGAAKFMAQHMDGDYLPTWLQALGYRTYFTGKFLNTYTYQMGCPGGWDAFDALDDKDGCYTQWYFKPVFTNCSGTWQPNGTYHQTDIIRDKGLGYIDDAVAQGKPFFIELAPTGPHDQGLGKVAVPCARHANLYPNVSIPSTPDWGVSLPPVMGLSTPVFRNWSTSKYVPRLRTLAGVDEMVGAIVDRLEQYGVLDNTYVIFTSDNGFHLGQHGMAYEKFTPYEEDVRVPFYIRGPGIPSGVLTDYPMTMVDVPATILTLAGGTLTDAMDGIPLPFSALGNSIPVAVSGPASRAAANPASDPPSPPPLPPQPPAPHRHHPPSPSTRSPAAKPVKGHHRSLLEALAHAAMGETIEETEEAEEAADTEGAGEEVAWEQPMPGPGAVPEAVSGAGPGASSGAPASAIFGSTSRHLIDGGNVSTGRLLLQAADVAGASATGPAARDTVLIEGWLDVNLTQYLRKNYRAVRVCSPVYVFGFSQTYLDVTCYKYTVWCLPSNPKNKIDGLNLHELYDLGLDPYELANKLNNAAPKPLVQRLVDRLDAVLTAMAYCRGLQCRNPWLTLHPDGSVNSLLEAMSPALDAHYRALQKFAFRACTLYYDPSNESADRNITAAEGAR